MPHAEASAVVPLPQERAFALAHDLGVVRAAWDPEAATSRLIRGAEAEGEGVHRFVKSPSGRRMILRTTTWFPPLASSCEMAKGPAWLRAYGESWRVERIDDERSRVTWKLTAKAASPVAPDAVGAALGPLLRRSVEHRMAGYVEAAERLAAAG